MARADILIIEDDTDINDIMAARLSREGHRCMQAWSGSEAELRLGSHAFDLVITDLMLPGLTGEEVVRLVRARCGATPVIVVSARTSATDKVSLLKLGADDYLAKPFDLDELAMRVEVQLRHRALQADRLTAQGGRAGAGAEAAACAGESASANSNAGSGGFCGASQDDRRIIRFGRWEIDSDARTLHVDGKPVNLTRIEFNIVELLAKHPRKVFTKRELFELAWGEPYSVEDNTVNVHVSRIRNKLRESGTDAYLCTVWGLGFKLADEQPGA